MSNRLFRLVARLGIAAKVPALIIGELGWDVDRKVFRVGDNTSTPPRIPSDKSVGTFEFPDIDSVRYKEIKLYENGKVDGVTPAKLNANDGVLVRIADNQFAHRFLEHDQYITIENASGVSGNPTIGISQDLIDLINNAAGGMLFSWGPMPPQNAKPGSLHYNTTKGRLYIRLTESVDDRSKDWWLDFLGFGSGLNGGKLAIGPLPPLNAEVGTEYLNDQTWRLYRRLQDENGLFWKEERI